MADGGLGWLNSGFRLDGTFLISDPFFFGGPILGYFPVTKGRPPSSGSRLYLVGGCDMSVPVMTKCLQMIYAGWTEVKKMAACRFSTALEGGFSLLFWQ